ncbi:hypothetical protein BH20VER3_BH20VER3_00070 [soil metagenome]
MGLQGKEGLSREKSRLHSLAMRLREEAIAEYHRLLAADAGISADLLGELREAMRRNRLVYGDRPLGVALRPHFLERKQFELLAERAELVAAALEKVTGAALRNPAMMDELGLTEAERSLALVEPGFAGAGISTRMDGFVHGEEIQFVEYNAENTSSLSDQEGLNRLLGALPEMCAMAQRYELREFSPVAQMLETLLDIYREWSGRSARPRIAIVDWHDLPTANEFLLLRDYFISRGVPTIICSPDELEYDRGKLHCSDFQIDLAYKRVVIHEFLARFDETHPLLRAYRKGDVCLVNPFRCKIMHKKASFEWLTDETHQAWFSARERAAIRASVPWTRRLFERRTTCWGERIDLLEFVRQKRARLVIKPNDDYGGRGLRLGSRMTDGEWDEAIATALQDDDVVQEAIDLHTEEFPIFSEESWGFQPMYVDTNPFLFRGKVCGALVRLSESPVVNVTSGGGETGFFVLEAKS